jgi:hypothetical protein
MGLSRMGRFSLVVVASLLAGCDPGLEGDWWGVFTNEEGRTYDVLVEAGAKERSLLAYQPERWRVHGAVGHVEHWFTFDGVFMQCIDGPCIVNVILAQDSSVEKSLHKYPIVPNGAYVVIGEPPEEIMRRCNIYLYGGRSWPFFAVLQDDDSPNDLAGHVTVGAGCQLRAPPGWEYGEFVLSREE